MLDTYTEVSHEELVVDLWESFVCYYINGINTVDYPINADMVEDLASKVDGGEELTEEDKKIIEDMDYNSMEAYYIASMELEFDTEKD